MGAIRKRVRRVRDRLDRLSAPVDACTERVEHADTGACREAGTVNAREYVKVIRRKWPVIVACSLAAAVVMWMITPAQPPPVERVTSYTATATLLVDTPTRPTDEAPAQVSLDRMALYITTGEIPARAAQRVSYTGDPAVLASEVIVTPNPSAQSLTLAMTGSDGTRVAAVTNAFAAEAVAFFQTPQEGTGEASVTLLQEATPIPVIASGGFSIPPSRTFRTIMAALLGLLIGFGLALVLHQIDSRLRTRDEVYEALRMPVISEVPKLTRAQRESARILVADEPHGVYADGYRTARAAVMHTASRDMGVNGGGGATPLHPRRPRGARVVLVTSAQASEGKTTSIANLGASFAETGQSVLVLDADLRSPDLHQLFDVPQGAGISDFLYDPSSTQLSALARPTSVAGVKIITAGTQLAHPASLATRMGVLIEESRKIADVVLVDTAPLLAASDVFDLLPLVDTVLFVVRSGRLTESAGQRVSEFLGRFHVPVTGAILVGTPSKRSDGYGYGYGSVSDDPAAQTRAKRKSTGGGARPSRPSAPRPSSPPRAPADGATAPVDIDDDGFDPYEGYDPHRDQVAAPGPGESPPGGTRRERRAQSR
jgi:capsular exopolysaccharide synthesis family protein